MVVSVFGEIKKIKEWDHIGLVSIATNGSRIYARLADEGLIKEVSFFIGRLKKVIYIHVMLSGVLTNLIDQKISHVYPC